MTLEDAKKVLGLDPSEDPSAHVEKFTEAREQIANLVRNAPNETIALRYQDGLLEFDKAMAAVREEIERKKEEKVAALMALVPGSVRGSRVSNKRADFHDPVKPVTEVEAVAEAEVEAKKPEAPVIEETKEQANEAEKSSVSLPVVPPVKAIESPEKKTSKLADEVFDEEEDDLEEESSATTGRLVGYAVIFLLLGGIGGGWIYTSMEADRKARNRDRVIFLESLGARLVESRRWTEAEEAYQEIAQRDPGSKVAETGIRSIEFGMTEEQNQFVAYWSGEALAAFEAGRIDEAAEAANKVLEKYPREKEAAELLAKIEAEKLVRVRQEWQSKIQAAVEERDWATADGALGGLSEALPGDPMVAELTTEILNGKSQEAKDHSRAAELAEAARLRDAGKFDHQALEWMREAVALDSQNPEIQALYEKLASYSRTIRVPEDQESLKAALADARDRDRIVLGEGTFEGGLVINAAVQLEGKAEGKTILKMNATAGPVLTFGPGAKGASVSGLVLQHEGFDAGTSRFPIALVRGAELEFSDCEFFEGSGHGLAVVDGGHAIAQRCTFKTNGWDGAAASGKGSRLTIRDSESTGNFGHGIEIWDGASAVISDTKSSRNSRNGVLVDSAGEGIEVTGGEFFGNREYGLVLSAGASGKVLKNSSYSNLMGGLLVRFAAISVVVEENQIEKNSGPGLILEQGLRAEIYEGNRSRANDGKDVMSNVQFAD